MADGILVCNLPFELRSMNALHHHFRRFGEILKLTIHNNEGHAFVQFAEQAAAEAARHEPVLGCTEVEVKWVLRDREQRARGRGRGRGRGEQAVPPEGVAQNRILVTDPEERRRLDDANRKKEQINARKRDLQQQLTEQLKILMVKLQDKDLAEEKRESYRMLLLKIKERMNTLSGVMAAGSTPLGGVAQRPHVGGAPKYTLDLRPRALRMKVPQDWALERLQAALAERLGSPDHVESLEWEDGSSSPQEKTSIVLFSTRWAAEQIFDQRGDFLFYVEWCEQKSPILGTNTGLAPAVTESEPAAIATSAALGDSTKGSTTDHGTAEQAEVDAEVEVEEEATWAEDASEQGDQDIAKGNQ